MTVTDEQISARRIGGSDIAVIMGVSPYKQAEELRLEKLGRIEPAPVEGLAADFGTLIEDAVAQMYERKSGERVMRVKATVVHPDYPWLTAHPDRRIVGKRKGLEIKNVGRYTAKEWGSEGSDECSESALLQSQFYMIATGYKEWDVASYFGGADLKIYFLEYDSDLADMIVSACDRFWSYHVLQDKPCDIDWSHRSTPSLLKRMHKLVSDKVITLDEKVEHWLRVKEEADEIAKGYEKVSDLAERHILAAMGDAGIAHLNDGTRLERRLISRKGYTVEPTEYETLKHVKTKEKSWQPKQLPISALPGSLPA